MVAPVKEVNTITFVLMVSDLLQRPALRSPHGRLQVVAPTWSKYLNLSQLSLTTTEEARRTTPLFEDSSDDTRCFFIE